MTILPRALSDAERSEIQATVARLTLDEKAALTAGRDMWSTTPVPGIPAWRCTDGPNGARGTYLGPAGSRALCMPCGSALAASWNPELVQEAGAALGQETRARGARVLLGPTVNIQRSPLGGRTFECFSEDPFLAGTLAVAYVRGAQAQGVITTVKHFAGNEAEFERHTINSIIDERALREIYLVPFEMAVKAGGSLGIMTANNQLNGTFCSNSRWLLADVLREDWGFEGITVSDWWALADTADAAAAGLDLEMPGPARVYGPALADAVRRGEVPAEHVDAIVSRLLAAMTRIEARNDTGEPAERPFEDRGEAALARQAACEAMVLVRNADALLPLSPESLKSVAVIGPNAARARIMGGGSATLRAAHLTAPLSALEAALAPWPVTVTHAPGCAPTSDFAVLESTELRTPSGEPGLEIAFFAGPREETTPLAVHRADTSALAFMGEPAPGVSPEGFSLRATGQFVPVASGPHRFRLETNGRTWLTLDGAEHARLGWEANVDGRQEQHSIEFERVLEAGRPVDLQIAFAGESALNFCHVTLRCLAPEPADMMEDAVRIAEQADVAIVVVGTGPTVESEGFDRTALALPGRQEELVRRVRAVNPRTIVVVNSGSPVAMPWLDEVPATLQCWFAGQEMAPALADILLGAAEPGGRMPISCPARIEDNAAFGNFPGSAGEVRYGEGLLVGYRWHEARAIPAAVPFGHGLSYAQFEWSASLDTARTRAGTAVTVSVTVRNCGQRAGSDVVQVYVAPPPGPLPRAPKELRGFAKVHLEPGEARQVDIVLDARAFAYWHPGDETSATLQQRLAGTPFAAPASAVRRPTGWTIEAGTHAIHVARSSADIVATLPLEIDGTIEGMR